MHTAGAYCCAKAAEQCTTRQVASTVFQGVFTGAIGILCVLSESVTAHVLIRPDAP